MSGCESQWGFYPGEKDGCCTPTGLEYRLTGSQRVALSPEMGQKPQKYQGHMKDEELSGFRVRKGGAALSGKEVLAGPTVSLLNSLHTAIGSESE